MANAEGKNWKPVYDRCVKTRTTCLGGQTYTPAITEPLTRLTILQQDGSGTDAANADPATRQALCDNGQARGDNRSCTLAAAGEGYGQSFSLLGPGVPLSRAQRSSSVVKCAGGKTAMFYPNGRIQSCTLDNNGALNTPLTDISGKVEACAPRALVRFDAEGRLLSCDRE